MGVSSPVLALHELSFPRLQETRVSNALLVMKRDGMLVERVIVPELPPFPAVTPMQERVMRPEGQPCVKQPRPLHEKRNASNNVFSGEWYEVLATGEQRDAYDCQIWARLSFPPFWMPPQGTRSRLPDY